MTKAVLFDFDGVFAETIPWHLAAWDDVLRRECGFAVDPMTIKLNEGRPVFEIARAVFETAQRTVDDGMLQRIIELKNQRFREIHRARVYQEIPLIIDAVKKRGGSVGLVTGTKRANIGVVVSDDLLQRLDVILADGDTARGKPWPDPYRAAAEKLRLRPSECMVIENAPVGVQSAKAAGMFCVALMTTLTAEQLQQADVTIAAHADLLNQFDQILAMSKENGLAHK